MKAKSIITAAMLMVSTMASAQYVNVKLDDGTYHSYKATPDTEVSFGEKKGTDPTVSTQSVTVNGHKVTVKLADGTPASDVALHAFIEGDKVKIKAMCWDGYGLECIKDNEVLASDVANGFYTFTVSNISKDMVVSVGYITVSFDLNNSNITDNFKAKPADITKMGYNSSIAPTYASAERHSFRGWYTDKECTKAWNYSTDKVTKSMTLYAKWAEDPTGTQINDHNFVKLGGYYWATENVDSCCVTAVADPKTTDNGWGFYFYKQADDNALYAAKSWGGTWTLPSVAQWQALKDYCDWTWTTDDKTGMNGYLVKGRADTYESDHSIFLPAAGYFHDVLRKVSVQSRYGYYWSTANGSCLFFRNDHWYMSTSDPYYGMPVRPVSE